MSENAPLEIRVATADDLPAIIAMLTDDFLGSARDSVDENGTRLYEDAFARIEASPDNDVYIVLMDDRPVGTFQLTFIPGLAFKGGIRAQIESVRVDAALRGKGIGARMIRHAVDLARQRNCTLVQLSMNKQRKDSERFYKRLGFEATHEGFKLML